MPPMPPPPQPSSPRSRPPKQQPYSLSKQVRIDPTKQPYASSSSSFSLSFTPPWSKSKASATSVHVDNQDGGMFLYRVFSVLKWIGRHLLHLFKNPKRFLTLVLSLVLTVGLLKITLPLLPSSSLSTGNHGIIPATEQRDDFWDHYDPLDRLSNIQEDHDNPLKEPEQAEVNWDLKEDKDEYIQEDQRSVRTIGQTKEESQRIRLDESKQDDWGQYDSPLPTLSPESEFQSNQQSPEALDWEAQPEDQPFNHPLRPLLPSEIGDTYVFSWAPGSGLRILTSTDLFADTDGDQEDGSEEDDAWEGRSEMEQRVREGREKTRTPLSESDDEGYVEEEFVDEGECRFRSTVEAYQTALTRLRSYNRELQDLPSASPSDLTHPNLSSYTQPSHPQAHQYTPSGHLHVSPDPEAEHPIPQLLMLGERRWEEMSERQSSNLGEAVEEYRKRYGRAPPRGFDVWWEFAQNNSVLLPDEYDRIHLDLAPFWALPRVEMRKRVREAMDMKETFVLVVEEGEVRVEVIDQGGLDWAGTLPRARDAASLIRPFAQHMPDMRAVFSIHDQPQIYLSASRRASLIKLGLRGEHTTHLRESDSPEIRWERSCSRDSNLRKKVKDQDEPGSLIYDTLEASDICMNPYLMEMHGLTVEKHGPASHPKPRTALIPLFGLAKTSINSDILVTPLDQFADAPGFDPPWQFKQSSKVAWRGSTTGISWMDKDTPWQKSHRFRLHNHAQNRSEEPVAFYAPVVGTEGGPLKMKKETGSARDLSEFFYDMKLAGDPLQCNQTDGTCDLMSETIEFAEHQPAEALNDYKFLFDIDGNSWSGRFRRLMDTKSLVLKAGIFTEWFQPHLIPWFSYIPTRLDFSDLPVILGFLRGTPESPDDGFDEVAEVMANNGRCFVRKMFRVEDLQAYMFRLFLEYARLMAATDENVDFVYDPETHSTSDANEGNWRIEGSKIWRNDELQDVIDVYDEID